MSEQACNSKQNLTFCSKYHNKDNEILAVIIMIVLVSPLGSDPSTLNALELRMTFRTARKLFKAFVFIDDNPGETLSRWVIL